MWRHGALSYGGYWHLMAYDNNAWALGASDPAQGLGLYNRINSRYKLL